MARYSPIQKRHEGEIAKYSLLAFQSCLPLGFTDRNPITHVRQATQRATQPVVLTNAEITALLSELREPARTAVFLALATGLRVSELLALQWQDIDFSNNTLTPTRGIV